MPTSEFKNLPKNWQIKELGEVCVSTSSNITFKNIQDKKGDYPIYGASGVVAYVDFYTKENESLGIVKDGAGIGRVFLLPPKASVIGTLHYIENGYDLNLKYLFYFLQSINLARYITGSAIPHIYFRDWKKEQIPLPPLEIQKRIVARLDEAFARIDNGTKHLKSAQNNIAKYKQSLLKSAFNGTLTNEPSLRWSKATEAIHSHRHCESLRQQGEAIHESKIDCHDLTSSNLAMTDKNSPSLAEGARGWIDSRNSETPNLPQGWTIKTLGELTSILGDGLHGTPKYDESGEFYFINGNNLDFNKICIKANTKKVGYEEFLKYKKQLNENTIFVSINGTLGNTATYNNENIILGKSVCYFNVNSNLDKYFILYFLQTISFNIYANKNATGSTIKNLSLKAMRNLPIPLPPLKTQKQIVAVLEKHFSSADKTSAFIDSTLKNAKQLKSSLLKSAFEGKLVQ
ncbi:restriction endonuclease subunit S [Helicobacter sp. T3_23-1059]